MSKAVGLVVLIAGLCGQSVSADEALLGKDFTTPSTSQPICVDPGNLMEFLMAGLKRD